MPTKAGLGNSDRIYAYTRRALLHGRVSSLKVDIAQRIQGIDWDRRQPLEDCQHAETKVPCRHCAATRSRCGDPPPVLRCRVLWCQLARGPLRMGPDGYLPRIG